MSDLASADRRVYLIDDLLGAILVIAATALAVLLDLTRRQLCAVYQLAFALCGTCAFFIIGGLIDHHLSNDQLHVALYGAYLSSSLTTSYVYVPIVLSASVSLALVVSLSTCTCDCCCLVGASSATHQRCFSARIRANLSLYGTCLVALYVAIGTRLNVRLRESAINPVGGTVHWALLCAPFYLALAHCGSLLLVGLKIFLQHADSNRTSVPHYASPAQSENRAPTPSVVEELMRPPPVKSVPLAPPRRPSDPKLALPRSPQATTAAAQHPVKTASPRDKIKRRDADNNRALPMSDGDVSSLISSDSDSDDGVLRPSFRNPKSLPPRHTTGGVIRRRPSSPPVSVTSGYSSSPPPSPTRSTVSTGSATSARMRPLNNGRPGSSSSSSSSITRPRLTSSGSSSSTTFVCDSDDHALSHLEAYGSSGNEYSSNTGIRRRAPTVGSAKRMPTPKTYHEPADWIECCDDATGSVYVYNTRTGESRWKD